MLGILTIHNRSMDLCHHSMYPRLGDVSQSTIRYYVGSTDVAGHRETDICGRDHRGHCVIHTPSGHDCSAQVQQSRRIPEPERRKLGRQAHFHYRATAVIISRICGALRLSLFYQSSYGTQQAFFLLSVVYGHRHRHCFVSVHGADTLGDRSPEDSLACKSAARGKAVLSIRSQGFTESGSPCS